MDLNKAVLMGNVGQDPEFHTMQNSGNELARFSLATSRKWTKDGKQNEDTSWHNIVVFNPYLIKVVRDFICKGTRIYLEGEIKTRSYEKDGIKQYITEIVIPQVRGEIIVIARGKGWDDSDSNPADRPNQQASQPSSQASEQEDYDDDIPF